MKKLTTISLFIFFCVVTAILTAGLVFYQNKKDSNLNIGNTTSQNKSVDMVNLVTSGVKILDMAEISKHNNQNDCWLLINSKVYDLTSYFGQHPGGSSEISPTCGKDATNAYKTQDPYATSAGSRIAHSTTAVNLLNNYYIGDLNQKISQNTLDQTTQKIKLIPVSTGRSEGYDDDDD